MDLNEVKEVRNRTLDTVLGIIKQGDKPCDCIEKVNGYWMQDCHCGNSGDLSAAASWCESQGLCEQIEKLKSA